MDVSKETLNKSVSVGARGRAKAVQNGKIQ